MKIKNDKELIIGTCIYKYCEKSTLAFNKIFGDKIKKVYVYGNEEAKSDGIELTWDSMELIVDFGDRFIYMCNSEWANFELLI